MSSANLVGALGGHLAETKSGKIRVEAERRQGWDWKFSWYLAFCTLFGGFVHFTGGYDATVVGGLFTKASFIQKFYPDFRGRKDSPYCTYASHYLGVYAIMLGPTMIVGCFVCGFVMRRWGRPPGIFICGAFNIAGAVIQLVAPSSGVLLLGRLVVGFGEGFGQFVYNIYLAEIAPAQIRAKIVGTSVTWSALGVFFGQLISYLVFQRPDGWKIIIGCNMIPSGLVMAASFFMHDTPASLMMRDRKDAARISLQKYRGVQNVDEELQDLEVTINNRITNRMAFKLAVTQQQYYPGIIINIVMYTFLIWTGNTAIVTYGPQIFSVLGFGSSTALWNSIIVGGAKILGVFIGVYLLDTKVVRRKLLITGGILQTLLLATAAIVFAYEVPNTKGAQTAKGWAAAILIIIIGYEISFMGGQQVPTLGMAAEVCPIEVRQAIFPVTVTMYVIQLMIQTYSFTFMLCAMVWGTFLFYGGLTFVLTLWVWKFMPETHHVPLERIPEVMAVHHIWQRFYSKTGNLEAATTKAGTPIEVSPAVSALALPASPGAVYESVHLKGEASAASEPCTTTGSTTSGCGGASPPAGMSQL